MKSEEEITKSYNDYNKGFEAGKIHSAPSPLTIQFMEKVNSQITDLKADFSELKNDIKERIATLPTNADMKLFVSEAIKDTAQSVICEADKKYAPKDIVMPIVWFFGVLVVALVGAVVKFIFDNIGIIK